MQDGGLRFFMGFLCFYQDRTVERWQESIVWREGGAAKKTRDGIRTQVTASAVMLNVGTLTTRLSAPMRMEIFVLRYHIYKFCGFVLKCLLHRIHVCWYSLEWGRSGVSDASRPLQRWGQLCMNVSTYRHPICVGALGQYKLQTDTEMHALKFNCLVAFCAQCAGFNGFIFIPHSVWMNRTFYVFY